MGLGSSSAIEAAAGTQVANLQCDKPAWVMLASGVSVEPGFECFAGPGVGVEGPRWPSRRELFLEILFLGSHI